MYIGNTNVLIKRLDIGTVQKRANSRNHLPRDCICLFCNVWLQSPFSPFVLVWSGVIFTVGCQSPKSQTLKSMKKNIEFLPQFKIENLPSGSEFKVNVFARNEKGISDKTEVDQHDETIIHLNIVLCNIETSLYLWMNQMS